MSATEIYQRAVAALLRYKPEVVDLTGRLTTEHPDHAMGNALLAYLCLTATDTPELDEARAAHARMAAARLDDQAAMHAAAIAAWLAGDWHGAAAVLDELLVAAPTDMLALLVGHQLDFFRGDFRNLRDRPSRCLDAHDPAGPEAAIVRGMYAFGLEEAGEYATAEELGMAAIATHPDDVWAIHAVVHSMEMRGQVERGIPFLRDRIGDWGTGNLFTVHNWWHLGLFELEAGNHAEVLDIYDEHVHNAESECVPLELLDASALLWRLSLDGVDTGDRFGTLADAWAGRAGNEPWYVFNDVHAVMAFAGAGRLDDARAVLAKLEAYLAASTSQGSNLAMTGDVGLPAAASVLAYAEGRDADVIDALVPIRRRLHHFGGSHAQRDVLQRTLLDAALRSGRHDLARALLSERLTQRDASVYGWTRRQRLLDAIGDDDGARAAGATAAAHRRRFAA